MVGGGTTICVSTATTTYSFDTLKSEWSKYGDWVLPFSGKAEHVPELGLWFAMSRTSLSRSGLYALDLDLSTAGAGDDASCQPPELYDIGVDLELRDDLFLFGHAVASLGSGVRKALRRKVLPYYETGARVRHSDRRIHRRGGGSRRRRPSPGDHAQVGTFRRGI